LVIVVVGLVFSGSKDFVIGQSSTSGAVVGNITRTTQWTFTESVVISQGATLTIAPGVSVDLNGYSLTVDGTLIAVGNSTGSINFGGSGHIVFGETCTAWNKQTNSGSVIANAVIETGLSISGSPLIYGNRIKASQGTTTISILGGSPLILNNDVTAAFESSAAINGAGVNPVISGNKITGYRDNGLIGLVAPSWDTTHMARFGASDGIRISGGTAYISDNTITNCAAAINVETGTATIERNLFDTNVFGSIKIGTNARAAIQSNTFTDQSGGIAGVSPSTTVNYNNFYNSFGYDLLINQTGNIDATNNWWGTTNTTLIEQKIVGGTANFTPFLTAENSNAKPVITPMDIPTPTIEPQILPVLQLSVRASSSYSNFNVEIKGKLKVGETWIPDALIAILSSINGYDWEQLTVVKTDGNGGFLAGWSPTVSGNYQIKAYWAGNVAYPETEGIVSFAATPYEDKSMFSVTTNSTISELSFNSTSKELSFTVSGPDGTSGFAEVIVPKSLLADVSSLKVYLGDSSVPYSSESLEDAWRVYFSYSHSAHDVTVSLAGSHGESQPNPIGIDSVQLAILIGIVVVAALLGVNIVLTLRKKRQPGEKGNTAS